MKKVLATLLAMVMLLTVLPLGAVGVSALASEITGDCIWTLEDGHLTISGKGRMGNYSGEPGLWGESITSVTIEEGVTTIGNYAFYHCSRLTSVTIPDSVTSIGVSAFAGCTGLTSINVPDRVTTIGRSAFAACTGLTSIDISGSVTTIDDFAFSNCTKLTSIDIPYGVTTIGSSVFQECTKLASVTIPNSVTSIGGDTFSYCTSLSSITIPDSVTVIESCLFYECTGLTSVTIPDGVKKIGSSAFLACAGLTSITIPESVTTIDGAAFSGCAGLTSILIPEKVATIGNGAFRNCTGLTSIVIPDSVKNFGSAVFQGCAGLTSITIPNTVTVIGVRTFAGCKALTSFTIHSGVTAIGDYAFAGCSELASVTIPESVTTISNYAFNVCSKLTDVRYGGTNRNDISIGYGNDFLVNATWHCAPKTTAAITTQPKGAQVKNGETAKVTIGAVGDRRTYTWYIKNKGATKYSKSSIKTATYSVKMSSTSRDRYVYCVVKDKYGNSVKSNTVVLRMAASITKESATAAYAKQNVNAKVTVTAAGDGLTYQWYVKNPGTTEYVKSSVKTASYSAKMTAANSGRLVYCIVKDKYGKEAKSKTFVLRMQATIVTQPKTVTVKNGTTAKTTVKVVGDGLTYTWYIKNKSASKYIKSSIKTNTYSVKMSNTVNGRKVYCVVKDKYGKTVTSSTVTLKKK